MSLFNKNQDEELLEEKTESLFSPKKVKIENPNALKPEEILSGFSTKTNPSKHTALENLKQKIQNPQQKPEPQNDSLLDKCKPFLTDEDGSQALYDEEPIYKLQSVAEILHSESNKAIEELSKKYDLMFEDFGKAKEEIKTERESAALPFLFLDKCGAVCYNK